ncbi:LCP family protein [Neobacillus pocheonensis]|uniref:LCP family protein n=1 Tax=Neobacillus pocheonensis TaxID=363869 RepID=UPI003D279986
MVDNNRLSSTRLRQKRAKKGRKKAFLLFFLIIFLAGAGYAGYVAYHAYKAVDKSYVKIKGREDKSEKREAPVYVSSDPFSVLLLGIENYADKGARGRSDTIMVATFNPKSQTMKLLSIPRDSLVSIPGRTRKNKINAAYSFGGKELAIKTVEQFLDIPIDYYVTVNFNGFKNIVDEVGGVTVDVPFDFDDINQKWERFYFHKGKQKLNGEEALVYARMRMKDPRGDFGRNDRQRQIVAALVEKLSSPKTLLKIDKISDVIGDNIETNMTVSEALAFRKKYSAFDSSRIEQLQIKGYDDTIRGTYYFRPDEVKLEEIKASLKHHLDITDDTTKTTTDENESSNNSTSDSNDSSSQ